MIYNDLNCKKPLINQGKSFSNNLAYKLNIFDVQGVTGSSPVFSTSIRGSAQSCGSPIFFARRWGTEVLHLFLCRSCDAAPEQAAAEWRFAGSAKKKSSPFPVYSGKGLLSSFFTGNSADSQKCRIYGSRSGSGCRWNFRWNPSWRSAALYKPWCPR